MKKRTSRKGRILFGLLVVVCVGLALVSTVGTVDRRDSIAVLDIAGTISENDGATYDQQYLLESLEEITADSRNKGLILHIDSPGGAVYQIDELYLKLQEYKQRTGRPIYAAVESYAASGGYYEACAADKIYANRNSITGSIGVIMGEFMDLSGLMDTLGIDVTYIASGKNKAMGNSYQPMTEEQKAIYQSIVNEYYDRFVTIVAEGRHLEKETVRVLADGRIYSATQALERGLIDGVEPFEDTLQRMKTDLGRADLCVKYYDYQAPSGVLDYLLSGSTSWKQLKEWIGQKETAETQQKTLPIYMYCQF